MNRLNLTLSGCMFLIAACGDERAPVRTEFNADVRSPFRYEFFDEENDCSTGLQTFEALTQMCINVQDPERNRRCAEDKRQRHFDEHCQESGYTWYESFACDIRLVGDDTPIEFLLAETEVRSRTQACAGYTRASPDSAVAHSERAIQVSDRVSITVVTDFAPRELDPERAQTQIQVSVLDPDQAPLVGPLLLKPATVGGYWHLPIESAFLTYQCEETWACD